MYVNRMVSYSTEIPYPVGFAPSVPANGMSVSASRQYPGAMSLANVAPYTMQQPQPPSAKPVYPVRQLAPPPLFKPAAKQDQGLTALQLIKVLFTGLFGSMGAVLLFGVPVKVALTAELLMNVVGSVAAEAIYKAEHPWAKPIMRLTNRLVNRQDKEPAQISRPERERCLPIVSAAVTTAGSLIVATCNYLYRRYHQSALVPEMPVAKMMKLYNKGTLPQKFYYGARLLGARILNLRPVKWFHDRPVMMFPLAIASGIVWGLGEGWAAQRMSRLNKPKTAFQL